MHRFSLSGSGWGKMGRYFCCKKDLLIPSYMLDKVWNLNKATKANIFIIFDTFMFRLPQVPIKMDLHVCKHKMTPKGISLTIVGEKLFLRNKLNALENTSNSAGRGSSIRCGSAWYADGGGFDPHVRKHSFVEFGHEIISTVILFPFRWFKKGSCQLLAKECALSTGKLPRRLAQELYW